MGNAKEKLITGTTVYMIGNVTSKLMQLLLLPIITGLLLTDEYGYYDLVISTVSLALPIITLQLTEALFRFLFKANKNERTEIVSTVVVFLCCSILFLAFLLFFLSKFTDMIQYPILIFLHYTTFTIFTFYQKLTRSLQKNTVFAISGVLHTFSLIGAELILLLGFKMRLEAMFIANVISNLVCFFYLEIIVKARNLFTIEGFNRNTLKSLLQFSLPLVPNSISWWFVKSINTYFVTFFLGVGFNGIYSVANKFPQLLTFVTSVFQMAWQESAIMESDSKSRSRFYSSVFNMYSCFLLTAIIIILPFIKIIMPYLVDESYLSGMIVIPILLVGVVFSSLSQFYGVGYLAFNETRGALTTTLIAAILNCLIVIFLIPLIGLLAPAIGTMIAYFAQWLYRIYQMRSYFNIEIKWRKFLLYMSVVILYIIMYYLVNNNFIQSLLLGIACIIFFIANKEIIKGVFNKFVIRMINKSK